MMARRKLQTRRQFIRNAGYMAAGVALFGCGGDNSDSDVDDGDGTPTDNDQNDPPTDDGASENEAPVWSTIPAQTWTLGVAVYLDLNDYVTDADGDALMISLDQVLPDGVTLNDGVISGTPTAETALATYVATADDGIG
jgi:hypothetical protein